MNIRLEQSEDYREVENLTRESFWNVYRPGCTEHYVLNRFRSNPDFVPELDLVMEDGGRIIGHIMFSRAELVLDDGTRVPSWTFGPLCCNPSFSFTFNNLYAWLGLLYYLCPLRIEGETGSAEEQPASNKSLRYTVTI